MHRHALTDWQWERIQELLPERRPGPVSKLGDRTFIEGVLYRAKTGCPWRDLPERFGPWKSVYNGFYNWADRGVWASLFKALQLDVDETGSIVDASVVRAHQDASGGKGGIQCNALGRSRGGFSTKLHAVVDTKARPLHIALTPGQQHDSTMAEELLAHANGRAFIADTAYDADRIVEAVRTHGMKPVICNNPTRKYNRRKISRALYRQRYRVEVFFHNLKRFRALATRYEKTAQNYLALVQLACVCIWLS